MLPPAGLGTTVHSEVRGISLVGSYEVEGDTVLLSGADCSDTSARLDGAPPEQVAQRLLHELAEAAMAQPGAPHLRDDGISPPA